MKRDKRKLSLSQETVRQLGEGQLTQVVGGMPTPTVETACYTWCDTCECNRSYTTFCNPNTRASFCEVC